MNLADLPGQLQAAMPLGIRIMNAHTADEHAPALQTQVIGAEYKVTIIGTLQASDPSTLLKANLMQRSKELLAKSTLPCERRGKRCDLRPLIEKLAIVSDNKIFMRLTARAVATGRPEEVLDALRIALENIEIERISLIFQG